MTEAASLNAGLHAQILAHMGEGVVLTRTRDGSVVYANPSLKSLFGHPPEELVGRPLAMLLATGESDDDSFPAALLDAGSTDCGWQAEVRFARADGSRFWSSINASRFSHPEHGKVLLMVLQDITRQKELRRELEESRQLQQRAQKLALIGHWRLDLASGELVYGTDELYDIFELPAGASLDRFDETVHADDRESVNEIMRKTLESGGFYDSIYRLVTRTGKHKWVHAIGEGVFGKDGKLAEIAGSVQDITAFRAVEDELLKMQKLTSLGVLAGGIAHDFNNIHTALFGNIELARSRLQPGQEGHEELAIAEKALQRARNLSNQLLTFAKGGDPVKRSLVLDALIGEVVRFDLAGSKVRFELTAPQDLWQVDADAGQMEQVFTNLAINAHQAMTGGGTLRITLANVALDDGELVTLPSGRYVRVDVTDDGIGIPEEHLAQIFDPYFTTKEAGSGLGLATAYSIVKRHGGHIEVVSRPGTGSCFTLYLPAATLQSVPAGMATQATVAERRYPGRVLVMDDEEELAVLATKILERDGFVVDTAATGTEAIVLYRQALAQGQPYDCIIMDLTIPGDMGGLDAIKILLDLHPGVRAIVSSGYAADPVLANFAGYGFRGVIPKPYTLATMRETVARVLADK